VVSWGCEVCGYYSEESGMLISVIEVCFGIDANIV
jgi:hypothetical protein